MDLNWTCDGITESVAYRIRVLQYYAESTGGLEDAMETDSTSFEVPTALP